MRASSFRLDDAKRCLLLLIFTAFVALSNIRRQCIDNYYHFPFSSKKISGDASILLEDSKNNNNDNNGTISHRHGTLSGKNIALVDYCAGGGGGGSSSKSNVNKDMMTMYYDTTIRSMVQYNRQAYANRHGYHILSGSREPLAIEAFVTPLAWIKAAYLHELLLKNNNNNGETKWLLWIDCDALVAQLDWSVEYVVKSLLQIDMDSEYDMIMAEDPHVAFNSGVILMRCNDWTRNLWKRVLQLAANESIRTHVWWEQKALLDLWEANKYEEQRRILITPHRPIWNAFWTERRKDEYQPNKSFVWHRVNCRKVKECNAISTKFFCDIMPKGEYPEELCR